MFYHRVPILMILTLGIVTQACKTQQCPVSLSTINLISDAFWIGGQTNPPVNFLQKKDTRCYTYALPHVFKMKPKVAIAISAFSANLTTDLFFSVKPSVPGHQANQIVFIIRAMYKYTVWNKVSINFLIQSTSEIEVGYYQRDTGVLGGCDRCDKARVQPIFLPFTQKWDSNKKLTIHLFIHGFEITSIPTSNNGTTPFQIQVTTKSYNISGITAILSTTTATQVNEVLISYVIFESNLSGQRNGFVEQYNLAKGLLTPINSVKFSAFKYSLFGISGFILNQNYNPEFNSTINRQFQIDLRFPDTVYSYLSFHFILFQWYQCQNCPSYPYYYNSKCIASCPSNTLQYDTSCMDCPANSHVFKNTCHCDDGYFKMNGACINCPEGQRWDGNQCLSCGLNAVWLGDLCQCIQGTYNISGICQTCPTGTVWEGSNCIQKCRYGQTWVENHCEAACMRNYNTYWNGTDCACNYGYIKKYDKCIPNSKGQAVCTGSTYFDRNQQKCLPCLQGCNSCNNCSTCNTCVVGYYKTQNAQCQEICGDGIRFILPCDDGNKIDGDGCSCTCRIEPGYTCSGGSPSSPDLCTKFRPLNTTLIATGQSHSYGKISLNIKLNWLPNELSKDSCRTCNNILSVQVINGSNVPSITPIYIPFTSYTFSVEFDFKRQPISPFAFGVKINPALQDQYFDGIDISQYLVVNIDPSNLAVAQKAQAAT